MFANKQDMEQAMTPAEVANALGLPALKDRKWQIFKTSATKGTGLDEAMEWYVIFIFFETIKTNKEETSVFTAVFLRRLVDSLKSRQ